MDERLTDVNVVIVPMRDHNAGCETDIVTISPCREDEANVWSVMAHSKRGGFIIACDKERKMTAREFTEAFRRQLHLSEPAELSNLIPFLREDKKEMHDEVLRERVVDAVMTTMEPKYLEGEEAQEFKASVEVVVASVFRLNIELLYADSYEQKIMRARHALTLLLRWAPMTYETIAGLVHRERTTVISALKRAKGLIENDEKWRAKLALVIETFSARSQGFNPHWDDIWIRYQEIAQ